MKLTKKEKILKLRAAEETLKIVADEIQENLDDVRKILVELGETPSDEDPTNHD